MPISWNEIRHNAVAFSKDWAGVAREEAEAKSFWDAFFNVFGIKRKLIASFEEPVKNLKGNWSFIDLFWKGMLLVEHKTRGKSLEKAYSQAMDYIQALKNEGREEECPRYVIVSDFARVALHDLEGDESTEFTLDEFYRCVDYFAFIPGYKQHKLDVEDPINIRAVELLGDSPPSFDEWDGRWLTHVTYFLRSRYALTHALTIRGRRVTISLPKRTSSTYPMCSMSIILHRYDRPLIHQVK